MRTFEQVIAQALQSNGLDVSLEELIVSCGLSPDDELGSSLEIKGRVERFGLSFQPGFESGGLRTRRVLSAGAEARKTDVRALLARHDESSTLELKSSMVFDAKRKEATGETHKSDAVTHSLLKTICGLANAAGGVILVGVDDGKKIVGLDGDFSCGIGNADQWLLQLSTFIKGRVLHGERLDPYVRCAVVDVEESKVAVIEVVARHELTFLRSEDGKRWEYYCRSGNKTERIDIESFEEHLVRKRGFTKQSSE